MDTGRFFDMAGPLDILARRWWAIGIRGLLGIVFGLLAFAMPIATMVAVVWLFGAYALLDGVFNLVAAWRRTDEQRPWWGLLLSGFAGIGAGFVSFIWPGVTAIVLVYLVAAWALLTGGLEVAAAITLRKEIEGEWMLALSGLVSIALGALLAMMPEAGAIGLVWYFGAYAMLFGVLLVGLSLRLRRRNQSIEKERDRLAA